MVYFVTKKVALFTNARDESKIKEWAAHHLLIGFDYIIIFDHNSIVPLTEVFKNFDKRVSVHRVDTLPQDNAVKISLMNRAITMAQSLKVDWFIYLDADEFIILNENLIGIKQLLNKYKFADSIALNWLMFGSNNLIEEPTGLMLESYTKSDMILNNHVKTFVRPLQTLNATNPHFYNMKNKNRMFGLTRRLNDKNECYSFNTCNLKYNEVAAYIAHYVNQAEKVFERRKNELPRDDTGTKRHIDMTDFHNKHNEVENLYPQSKYSESIKKFLEQY